MNSNLSNSLNKNLFSINMAQHISKTKSMRETFLLIPEC